MASTQKLQVGGEGNIEGVQRELTNYCRLCQAFPSATANRPLILSQEICISSDSSFALRGIANPIKSCEGIICRWVILLVEPDCMKKKHQATYLMVFVLGVSLLCSNDAHCPTVQLLFIDNS